jgi:hypothetical protein
MRVAVTAPGLHTAEVRAAPGPQPGGEGTQALRVGSRTTADLGAFGQLGHSRSQGATRSCRTPPVE